ncbi:hypothetical protein [Phocaeicola sp.]|uniref:hypothetical protein n=1 Tax=Phocaeicola sp. TaxID=2773926 RepID=UPI0023CB1960|nr:hypothetical protein [Phocaeicola sp.]MDE5676229.1 hypothetical protein [Phocaeicola sp.]
MSMEHKAFVFDTKKFHTEIEPVMKDSIRNTEAAHRYICEHLDELQSPYTGDTLEEGWEEEFGELTLQVYFDILLTACYNVEDDCGLCEMWDAVNEVIKNLDVFEEGELPVLGWTVEIDDVVVDPGMEGLGIIDCDEVEEILNLLEENRDEAENAEPEDLLCEAEPEEWMEAYDNLCNLYKEALRQNKGLLLTF